MTRKGQERKKTLGRKTERQDDKLTEEKETGRQRSRKTKRSIRDVNTKRQEDQGTV